MAGTLMFALGAILSLCFIPGWTGAFLQTQWAVLSIVLPFFLWRSGEWTVFHRAGSWFLLYGVFLLLIFSPSFYGGVYGLWLMAILGLTFWLGSTLASLRELYKGLAVGAVVSSAVAVAQHFGMWLVLSNGHVPSGIYFNTVVQGETLALVAIALLTERLILPAMLLLPGIYLSESRGAWLMLAIGVLGLFVRRAWLIGLIAIPGVIFMMLPASETDQHRMVIWGIAIRGIEFFGRGPGSFLSVAIRSGAEIIQPEYAHNDILQLLFEYGIGAAVPLAIFAFALGQTASRPWPVVLAFVAAGLYSWPLSMPLTAFLGVLAAARCICDWAVVRRQRHRGGSDLLPRARSAGDDPACEQPVPVVLPDLA